MNSSWHDISKGWLALVQGSLPIWDSGAIAGQVIQQRALLSESKITYDDDVRQVELEIQQAYSNLQQNEELVKSQEKNVELAEEALRLAKARLDAGAGVQLDVLNAQVQLLTAQSTRLQALFRIQLVVGGIRPRHGRAEHVSGDVRRPRSARHENERPITPAVAWTRKESQSKVTTTVREFGLEDPELQIPNRPQSPNSKRWRRLKFSNNVSAFRVVTLSGAKHPGATP